MIVCARVVKPSAVTIWSAGHDVTPERLSPHVQCTVTGPGVPAESRSAAPTRSASVRVWSMLMPLTVASRMLPAASAAVPDTDCAAPSVDSVVGVGHDATPESASAHDHDTVTGALYQPFDVRGGNDAADRRRRLVDVHVVDRRRRVAGVVDRRSGHDLPGTLGRHRLRRRARRDPRQRVAARERHRHVGVVPTRAVRGRRLRHRDRRRRLVDLHASRCASPRRCRRCRCSRTCTVCTPSVVEQHRRAGLRRTTVDRVVRRGDTREVVGRRQRERHARCSTSRARSTPRCSARSGRCSPAPTIAVVELPATSETVADAVSPAPSLLIDRVGRARARDARQRVASTSSGS